jgi:hypothetical protein
MTFTWGSMTGRSVYSLPCTKLRQHTNSVVQEDTLISGLNKHQENLIQKIHDEEAVRNRSRVSEIVEFVEKCMLEIDQAEENAY